VTVKFLQTLEDREGRVTDPRPRCPITSNLDAVHGAAERLVIAFWEFSDERKADNFIGYLEPSSCFSTEKSALLASYPYLAKTLSTFAS